MVESVNEMAIENSQPGNLPDIWKMSEEELQCEIEKGLRDVEAGRVKPAKEVFEEIRRMLEVRRQQGKE